MAAITSNNYLTDWAWIRDIVGGQNLILRAETALLYLQLFNGYLNEDRINVYARERGQYANIAYYVVDRFDGIDYFLDGNVMCSSFNQAINDMLADFDTADEEALAQALSNYYHSNNESFAGLFIRPENSANFEYMRNWAIEYYNES